MRYKEDRSVSARGGQQCVCDVERVKHAALCAAMASAGAAVMPAHQRLGFGVETLVFDVFRQVSVGSGGAAARVAGFTPQL